ncbi:hypothetical protein [Tolypothrix sp. VBCCA 56010]|uniref:hypothetical protein n=1 Tax=Tolypothrix sp. VBCCA 56010 TaxID=3137731 RepID=UPI003D7E0C67
MYTIPELLNIIPSIEYDQRIFFTDPNYQEWYLELEESCDEETDEYFPNATIQHWENCYRFSNSVAATATEAIVQCLYDLDLISEETYSQYQTSNY